MKLLRQRLENYRAFKNLDLNFAEPPGATSSVPAPRHRTVIIGANSTCKSSVLRAIAIGLAKKEDGNALVAEPIGRIVKEGEKDSKITLKISRNDPPGQLDITTTIKNEEQGDNDYVAAQEPESNVDVRSDPLICAYGAARGTFGYIPYRTFRLVDSCYSLFQYDQPLENPELVLRRIRDSVRQNDKQASPHKGFEAILSHVKRAIGLYENDTLELDDEGGGLFVRGTEIGKQIPFDGWADGFRLTLAYLLDLYSWALRHSKEEIKSYADINGILLIDELEQHLHPSLQRTALRRLSELLPNMQIIATTHSPFVVLDAIPEEVIVLKRENDEVRCLYPGPDMTGYSVEDVIVHAGLFDTPPYSPAAEQRMTEYARLLQTPVEQMSEQERQRLRDLLDQMQGSAGEFGPNQE